MSKSKSERPVGKQATPTAPKDAEQAAAQPTAEAAAGQAPAPEAATEEPEGERAARLDAEVASLKDQLLRALAETENVRRRSRRERDDAVKYAVGPLVKDLIEVADNLRRALDSVPSEAIEADPQLKTLMTGVEMTESAFQAVLEKHHIVKIDPLGERLDPHYHEAMFEVPNPDAPAGTVLQVVRSGYRLHDRLLRAAQVGVATGGPSSASRKAPEAAADERAAKGDEAQGPGAGPEGNAGSAPGSRLDTTA